MALILSSYFLSQVSLHDAAFAQQSVGLREYIDTFDGYSFKLPRNWIQVRVAGADIFPGTLMFSMKIFMWSRPLPHSTSTRVLKTWVHLKKLERKYL